MLAVKEVENVELMKYVPYDQDILYLETVYGSSANKAMGLQAKKHEESYDLNYHLVKTDNAIKDIFYALQEKIRLLPGVNEIIDQKTGITYRTTKSFVFFQFGKGYIDIELREPKYNDPKKFVKDITHLKFGYKGLTKIRSMKDVNYVFGLIKQSYEQTL